MFSFDLKLCKFLNIWLIAFIYNDRIYEGSFSEDDTSLLIPVLADIQVDQPEKASQKKGNFQEGSMCAGNDLHIYKEEKVRKM